MALCVAAQGAWAQDGFFSGNDKVYQQNIKPSFISNYENSTYLAGDKGVFNLLQGKLNGKTKIRTFAVDPNGKTYAYSSNKKKSHAYIFDLWKNTKQEEYVSVEGEVRAICYSGDGAYFVVADDENNLTAFNVNKGYDEQWTINMPFIADKLVGSSDGKFVAAVKGQRVVIVNINTQNIVESILADGDVNDIAYSCDSKDFALLSNGAMKLYDAQTYKEKMQINSLGEARSLAFHPVGEYVSVVTSPNNIVVVNLLNSNERYYVDAPDGSVSKVLFENAPQNAVYMVYNSGNNIHYKHVVGKKPSLGKQVENEVEMLMKKWEMKLDNESEQEYAMRVNDRTRATQARLFEEQVATRMAGDYTSSSTMSFSRYNPATSMMQLDFDNMAPIFLPVESSDINSFTSADDIEFRNPIYTVKNDNYELVYADVYNKKSGKTYTFDNRDRKSLDYLATDRNFMPMEYAQQNSTNFMKLDEIKKDVVSAAKKAKSISDHTNITVNTEMIRRDDSSDQAIDYKVGFGYSVEAAFSGKEDFPSGRYNLKQSKAGQAMLSIIKEALNSNFAQYIKEGKKVTVRVTGSADGSAIKKTLPYAGEYGDIVNVPVTKNNEQTNVTVTKKQGIKTNDQLAYLRAAGMRNGLINSVPSLKTMDATYETIIEQAEGVGGEFRRIFVDFIFEDAFSK